MNRTFVFCLAGIRCLRSPIYKIIMKKSLIDWTCLTLLAVSNYCICLNTPEFVALHSKFENNEEPSSWGLTDAISMIGMIFSYKLPVILPFGKHTGFVVRFYYLPTFRSYHTLLDELLFRLSIRSGDLLAPF